MNHDAGKHIVTQVSAVITGTGAIASWIEHLDYYLRIGASAIAIVVGTMAIIDWFKKKP